MSVESNESGQKDELMSHILSHSSAFVFGLMRALMAETRKHVCTFDSIAVRHLRLFHSLPSQVPQTYSTILNS